MVFLQKIVFAGWGVCLIATAAVAQSITLDQVIRDVCTKSDSVQIMKESLLKSEQMVREKRANALPLVAFTGAYAHNYGSAFGGSGSSSGSSRSMAKTLASPATPGPDDPVTYGALNSMLDNFSNLSDPTHSNVYSAGLSFNQPIYTFGKISSAIKVARTFGNSARSSYRRSMQSLQLDAFDLYYRTFLAEKAMETTRLSLERRKETSRFIERNFQGGSGSRAQVLLAKADVTTLQTSLIEANRDAEMARMNLNRMIGRKLTDSAPFDTLQVVVTLAAMKIPAADEAVVRAVANRQDIQAVKYLAESNRGGAKIMKSMYYPTIGANGSVGYSKMDSENSMFSNDGNPSWMLGVGLSWTLFDGFANSARSAEYLSDARKLDRFASTLEKFTEMETRAGVVECTAADSAEAAMADMLAALREAYQLTKIDFEQGSGRLVELQQAEERLQQAELGMARAHYRTLRSRAALLVAMGEYIVTLEDTE